MRPVRSALCLGAALVLAACAPLPVTERPQSGTKGPEATCRADDRMASSCPPAVGAAPMPGRSSSRPIASPPAADVGLPDTPSEPPRESDQQGLASWYGPGLHGRRTANGERFDRYELTAAHRTLPFGSRVCVRSAVTGKTVVVRINDRGPFIGGRVIDLSQGAAQELGMTGLGIKPVELWLLNKSEEACPDALPDAPALAEADDDGVTATAPRQVVRKPAARKSRVVAPTSRARSRSIRR